MVGINGRVLVNSLKRTATCEHPDESQYSDTSTIILVKHNENDSSEPDRKN